MRWHNKVTSFAGPWGPCAQSRRTVVGSARAVDSQAVMTKDGECKGPGVPVDDGRWTT